MRKKVRFLIPLPAPLIILLLLYAHYHPNPLPEGARADRIIVEKGKRAMHLLKGSDVLKTYSISLGPNPSGQKMEEGDGKTPEGIYTIDSRNPHSECYLALHISYPSESDSKKAAGARATPGSEIRIHGLKNGLGWIGRLHLARDWTRGCIAVSNPDIEEIWRAVPNGTPIEIVP